MQRRQPERIVLSPWIGPLVAGLGLILYLSTYCRDAYPVASSSFLTTHGGIDPFQSYQNPLWSLLLRVVDLIPMGSTAGRANLLSACLAALSLWLMYYLVAHIRHDRTTEETMSGFSPQTIGAVSGVFAAGFLAVSPPFWFIATRAHPLSVNVPLLLGCAALLVRKTQTESKAPLYLACLLVGVGMIEFPTMILLAPGFGLWVLYLLWHFGEATVKRILLVLGITLTGVASILLVAVWFQHTEAYGFREFEGTGDLLVHMIRDQYSSLRRSAPNVGWLTVMLFTILPWFFVVVIPKRALLRRQSLVGSYTLHAVLSVVGLLILFNTQIAPFRILELRSLLVTPYLFAASWMGYLAGYWHIMFRRTRRHEDAWLTKLRHRVGRVHFPAQVVTLVAALWCNAALVDPDQGAPAARMARELVANLDGRTWLLSNGHLDSMIQLAAKDAGVDLTLIDTSRAHLGPYRRYLARLLGEPRLKSLVEIGLPQMLDEWARIDPELHRKLAVLVNADFWYGLNLVPVPAGVMFLGETEAADSTTTRDMERDVAFFGEMARLLDASVGYSANVNGLNAWLRAHISKVANNTGYYLEDHDASDLAYRAYQQARELRPDNLSALLNMRQLAVREQRPEAEELAGEVETLVELVEQQQVKLQVWSLSYHCGYVRNPMVLYDRGQTWALSGQPAAAIREIQRGVELSGVAASGGAQLTLAALYGQEGDVQESERLYSEYLAVNPNDVRALTALSRLEMSRGDFDMAETYLARIAELGVPQVFLEVERGAVELLQGNKEAAAEHLDRALELEPDNQRAMTLRVLLAADLGDEAVVDEYTKRLKALGESSVIANLTLAELAVHRGEFDEARAYLEALVDRGMGVAAALQQLLSLDINQGRTDLGEHHVKALLQIDPHDARGNLILGSLHFSRGEFSEAEAAFRASLDEELSGVALNNLGWIMVEKGDFAEGLKLADQALELSPTEGSAWDTKGIALRKLDRPEEAEQALLKAAEYSRGRPSILLHLAELYEANGDLEKARTLVERLQPILGDLPQDLADEINRMLARLR